MKVKHLLCGIVVAIFIVYIFKVIFHGGNGFSIGGEEDECLINISGEWFEEPDFINLAFTAEQNNYQGPDTCTGQGKWENGGYFLSYKIVTGNPNSITMHMFFDN